MIKYETFSVLERHQAESTKPPLQEFRASFRRLRAGSFKDDKNKTERTHNYSTLDRDNRKMEDETLSRKISAEMRHLILGRTKSADDDGKTFCNKRSQKTMGLYQEYRCVFVNMFSNKPI